MVVTYNLQSLDYFGIVVKRLAIGPAGQIETLRWASELDYGKDDPNTVYIALS
jgi:hypothetical protein